MNEKQAQNRIPLTIGEGADELAAARLSERFPVGQPAEDELCLRLDGEGLALVSGGQELRGDFTRLLSRVQNGAWQRELLARAAKLKGVDGPLTAVDATAGLGEDSLVLAAAGYCVRMYERNDVIYELLRDAVERARKTPELAEIAGRMEVLHGDSAGAMAALDTPPDIILLDPMFPARQKSALVKKKLQMIQQLETPCTDEASLLLAAAKAKPRRLIIKRPPKGPFLAGVKPDYSISGKAVRFDCIADPFGKLHTFKLEIPTE
ncbi:MAG: class I SAM-dependent methyltransferase [Oscillibacter sp.]|nr:class I SAM-dependent methyltransferase [Oscillibacter sp.]